MLNKRLNDGKQNFNTLYKARNHYHIASAGFRVCTVKHLLCAQTLDLIKEKISKFRKTKRRWRRESHRGGALCQDRQTCDRCCRTEQNQITVYDSDWLIIIYKGFGSRRTTERNEAVVAGKKTAGPHEIMSSNKRKKSEWRKVRFYRNRYKDKVKQRRATIQ